MYRLRLKFLLFFATVAAFDSGAQVLVPAKCELLVREGYRKPLVRPAPPFEIFVPTILGEGERIVRSLGYDLRIVEELNQNDAGIINQYRPQREISRIELRLEEQLDFTESQYGVEFYGELNPGKTGEACGSSLNFLTKTSFIELKSSADCGGYDLQNEFFKLLKALPRCTP